MEKFTIILQHQEKWRKINMDERNYSLPEMHPDQLLTFRMQEMIATTLPHMKIKNVIIEVESDDYDVNAKINVPVITNCTNLAEKKDTYDTEDIKKEFEYFKELMLCLADIHILWEDEVMGLIDDTQYEADSLEKIYREDDSVHNMIMEKDPTMFTSVLAEAYRNYGDQTEEAADSALPDLLQYIDKFFQLYKTYAVHKISVEHMCAYFEKKHPQYHATPEEPLDPAQEEMRRRILETPLTEEQMATLRKIVDATKMPINLSNAIDTSTHKTIMDVIQECIDTIEQKIPEDVLDDAVERFKNL